jgi:class 3 adenylate cyclase/predicted ATPase
MIFDEVLDRVLEMLQRRGRVSYRALKRQFDLDDAYLADLKAEIIDVHQLAVDQDGTMLVWTGAATASATPPQRSQHQTPLDKHSARIESPPAKMPTPDAERRQLTVMFCDLVDSTRLASQLDPEDYRTVIRAYQQACAAVIQPFDGHIAQYLGDGLLVYFGYPQAHEDDAQRAMRAGLGMLEAMQTLNARLMQDKDVRVSIRLGIHSGLVVVGAMGGGDRQEQLALGDTPNIAARLQGLAVPDTMVISAATYRLVQGYFVCRDLGRHTVKGVDEPLAVHQVLQASAAQSRLEAAAARGLTPLVGREEAQFPDTAQTQPELLAHHSTEAGLAEQAIHYWYNAGQHAMQRSAYQETCTHCAKGLEVLATLPETPGRLQHELAMQTLLASALHAFGPASPALAQVFNRTWQLCQQVDNSTQVVPVLRGLSSFYNTGAQYHRACEVGQRLLALAQQQHDQSCLLEAYRALGTTTLYRGDIIEAARHLEHALALYASHFQRTQHVPQYAGIETGVCCVIYHAHALWFLGYGDQAHECLQQGLKLAEASSYPFTLTWALTWAARAAQSRREVQTTLGRAEVGLALAEKHGFVGHIPQGRMLRGWALTMQERSGAHLAPMRQQLSALEAMGTRAVGAYARLLLAEALSVGEQSEAALTVLTEALAHMETTHEQTFRAEAYRLKGELLLSLSRHRHEEAEICFHQALAIARRQQAKSWELRAATSLSRLWQQQGKRDAARQLLAEVYHWFTEGFDTADLQEAKALLDELA